MQIMSIGRIQIPRLIRAYMMQQTMTAGDSLTRKSVKTIPIILTVQSNFGAIFDEMLTFLTISHAQKKRVKFCR